MPTSPNLPHGSPRKSISFLKIAVLGGLALAGLLVIAAVILVIKHDDILNGYVKNKLVHGVEQSGKGNSLTLSDIHYQLWQNIVTCDSGSISLRDAATGVSYGLNIHGIRYSVWGHRLECNAVSYFASDSSSACTIDTVLVDGIAPFRLMDGKGIAAMLLAEARIQLSGVVVRQPSAHTSLECASLWISPADSQFTAQQLTESDSSRKCSMGSVSLRGTDWRRLFTANQLIPTVCATSRMDATDIVILYPGSQYEFRCSRVHISFLTSAISADSVAIEPVDGDAAFFADSRYRKTRIRFDSPRCSMEGADLCGLLDGTSYAARLVQIQDATIEILINKEKPVNKHDPPPRMPHEILAEQMAHVRFDSVQLINGTVYYQERFIAGKPPAKLMIDSMNVLVNGFGNGRNPADTAKIAIQARLQGNAFRAAMSVPLAGAGLSARCSGSLNHTELSNFNSWLEIEDAMRVKSGRVQEASFEFNVTRGTARGSLRAIYRNFYVAAINAETKSDAGFFNRIKSFLANTFKLHSSNEPDKSGKVKLAPIAYVHKKDEPFFQFLWFSLRSGLKVLVGFP